jgi:hypothetical protein
MAAPRIASVPRGALLAAFLAVAAVALAPGVARATYLPQERIPTDSPVYRDLERLATTYRFPAEFLSTRPLRLEEAMTYLEILPKRAPGVGDDPAWQRAVRYVERGMQGSTSPLYEHTDGDDAIQVSPYASFLYDDDPRNRPDLNRDYRVGVRTALSLDQAAIFYADLYAGTASQGGRGTPNFGTFNALVEGVDFNTWMNEAYVEVPLSRLRLLAGHTWLRWGPGRDGTLALSDAAPALDMLRGELTVFRNFRLQWFVAMLDPGPQSYLAGHRLEARLGDRVEVGLTEMARFTGTSQAPLYFMPLVPYPLWEKRPKTGTATSADTSGLLLHKNNVLQSADIVWHFRPGARVWGELMIDDISFSGDYKPDLIGYQLGMDVRRSVAHGRMLGLSVEASRVNQFTYSHFTGQDFSFEGFPAGYVYGPDVLYSAAELTYEHNSRWEFGVRTEYRKKGEGVVGEPWSKSLGKVDAGTFGGVVEKEVRVTWSAVYTPARWLRLEARVGTSQIKNLDHAPGLGWDADVPVLTRGSVVW